jgi:plasmid stabilization system protein ParE
LAVQCVNEYAEFIARDRPAAAVHWAEGIFDAVERLEQFPFSGREVEEVRREDVREVVHGGVRIIYRVEETRVLILTVRHQRQLLDETELANEA